MNLFSSSADPGGTQTSILPSSPLMIAVTVAQVVPLQQFRYEDGSEREQVAYSAEQSSQVPLEVHSDPSTHWADSVQYVPTFSESNEVA